MKSNKNKPFSIYCELKYNKNNIDNDQEILSVSLMDEDDQDALRDMLIKKATIYLEHFMGTSSLSVNSVNSQQIVSKIYESIITDKVEKLSIQHCAAILFSIELDATFMQFIGSLKGAKISTTFDSNTEPTSSNGVVYTAPDFSVSNVALSDLLATAYQHGKSEKKKN